MHQQIPLGGLAFDTDRIVKHHRIGVISLFLEVEKFLALMEVKNDVLVCIIY